MSLAGAIATTSILLLLLLLPRAPFAEATPSDVAIKMEHILSENGCRAFAGLVAATAAAGEAFRAQIAGDGGGTGLTIFCPDDDAVAAFGPGRFDSLTADGQVALLLYHGVPRLYSEEALRSIIEGELPTLAYGPGGGGGGGDYDIQIFGDTAILSSSLNEANITKMVVHNDRLAVYLIDAVLVPQEQPPSNFHWAAALYENGCGAFAGLVAATADAGDAFREQIAGVGDGGGAGLTVFCPDDDAVVNFGLHRFTHLSDDGQAALLLYHGVPSLYSEETLQATMGGEVATLASWIGGGDYNISIFGDTAMILSSSLSRANITKMAVHNDRLAVFLIDSVLVPRWPTPTPFFLDWKFGLKVLNVCGIMLGILALMALLIGLVRLVCWLRRSYQDFAAAHASAARVAPDA